MQYEKKTNVSLLLDPTQIKSLPKGPKFLPSTIATSIKEIDSSHAWKCFGHHCANVRSQNKGIDFYQYYSLVAHSDLFRIKIDIAAMNILTDRILDVNNIFKNTNVTINEIVCFSPPPYYLDWFERSYPNVPLNQYYGPFPFN